MQPARDTAISNTSTASPGRRLLSRFTSGLTSKPRSLADFYIQLDDDGRTYFTGDTIRGSVRFRVLRPIRITHVTVSISGRVQVFKNPITPGEHSSASSVLSSTGRSRTGGQYHGNGVATLFEEETVLCGDGRLSEGTYHFNFELDFPPERDLPSSVDFERGKISYAITASITRPTTIAPVTSCERDVVFTERIDIAPIYPPKARTITLEPMPKRSKAKSLKLRDNSSTLTSTDWSQKARSPQPEQSGDASIRPSMSSLENDRPLSPVPSDLSVDSHPSSTGIQPSSASICASVSPAASLASRPKNGQVYKTIGTTIESLNGGCLRGDQMAVKVTINHSKYMKSMNGVIVTLYRHARVDTQPALPIGPLDSRKNDGKQSYFPQSRTGLSGLSLSGAGSARIFRKDLAQAVSPLVVNPATLTAEMLVKLRVPEFAFPTISGVPGSMISFKYYVEVIVDIQGKLSSPVNPLNELTGGAMSPAETSDAELFNTTLHGSRILDTTHVRRDKGVVCSNFEIIIGTVDSERKKNKGKAIALDEPVIPQEQTPATPSRPPAFASLQSLGTPDYILGRQFSQTDSAYAPEYQPYMPRENGSHEDYLAVPQLPDQSQLSEKERIRLAEARLLPSQPPGMDDADGVVGATAPVLDDEYGIKTSATAPVLEDGYHEQYHTTNGAYAAPSYGESGSLQYVDYGHSAPQDEYSNAMTGEQVNDITQMEGLGLSSDQSVLYEAPQEDHSTPTATSSTQANGDGLDHWPTTQQTNGDVPRRTPQIAEVVSHPGNDTAPAGQAADSQQHDSHADASALADLPRYER